MKRIVTVTVHRHPSGPQKAVVHWALVYNFFHAHYLSWVLYVGMLIFANHIKGFRNSWRLIIEEYIFAEICVKSTEKFDILMELMEKSGDFQYPCESMSHLLGTRTVITRFYGSPSNRFWVALINQPSDWTAPRGLFCFDQCSARPSLCSRLHVGIGSCCTQCLTALQHIQVLHLKFYSHS